MLTFLVTFLMTECIQIKMNELAHFKGASTIYLSKKVLW